MKKIIFKLKKLKILKLLLGDNAEFVAEHQVLNGSVLFIGFIYLLTVILNYLSELSFIVTIINSIVTIVFAILYYFSRIKKLYSGIIVVFYLTIFCSLTIDCFFAAGLISSMPFFYLALICYIVFFSNGKYK